MKRKTENEIRHRFKCTCVFAYFLVAMLVKNKMKLIARCTFYEIIDRNLSLEMIYDMQPTVFFFFLLTYKIYFHTKYCANI